MSCWLARETNETVAGAASIAQLFQVLSDLELSDQVTFALLNVFGRTLASTGTRGRNHNSNHSVGIMVGAGVRPAVVGGVVMRGREFSAQAIDSESGRGVAVGDISFESSMGAYAKTLGAALGIGEEVLDEEILTGRVVRAAVA